MIFRHQFRVYEVEPAGPALLEITLLSCPESEQEKQRNDRVSTAQCMGKVRIFVDAKLRDKFEPGTNFTLEMGWLG